MNKARPKVKIKLDKERSLRLDLNAMCAFEEATGKSFFGGAFDPANMSMKDLRAMLWACLLHEDEKVTLKQVGSWISADNMVDITNQLGQAFQVAIPEAKVDDSPLATSHSTG